MHKCNQIYTAAAAAAHRYQQNCVSATGRKINTHTNVPVAMETQQQQHPGYI